MAPSQPKLSTHLSIQVIAINKSSFLNSFMLMFFPFTIFMCLFGHFSFLEIYPGIAAFYFLSFH